MKLTIALVTLAIATSAKADLCSIQQVQTTASGRDFVDFNHAQTAAMRCDFEQVGSDLKDVNSTSSLAACVDACVAYEQQLPNYSPAQIYVAHLDDIGKRNPECGCGYCDFEPKADEDDHMKYDEDFAFIAPSGGTVQQNAFLAQMSCA